MSENKERPKREVHPVTLAIAVAVLIGVVVAALGVSLTLHRSPETRTAPQTPSASPTATSRPVCESATVPGLFVGRWQLVVASIARDDHKEMVRSFADNVREVQLADEKGCASAVEFAELSTNAALLNVVVTADVALPKDYKLVIDAGNAWLNKIGSNDRFEGVAG